MRTIVISPKSNEEQQFISKLLRKLGVSSKILSKEDTEDLGLSMLMKDLDRSEVVSEEEIMSKLKNGFRHTTDGSANQKT